MRPNAKPERDSRKEQLRKIGSRPGVIQIVPTREHMRPPYVRDGEAGDHELVTRPLASPTGPGAAKGFKNRGGSQIAKPEVTNIYLGPFWGDKAVVEGFSTAVLEHGYLEPLKTLKYGTGPGKHLGSIDGRALAPKSKFSDADAQAEVAKLLDQGIIKATANSLFMLILPDKVRSTMTDGSRSCAQYCGYHDAFDHKGMTVAYAVLPSPVCKGCGRQMGDFTAVYAHELAEAATDKVPGKGWVADDGEENGDLEAWILFGWGPPEDPHRYTVQGYYTNERGNTVGNWQ